MVFHHLVYAISLINIYEYALQGFVSLHLIEDILRVSIILWILLVLTAFCVGQFILMVMKLYARIDLHIPFKEL